MNGFDFIVIMVGACLIAFMILDFLPKPSNTFTNFEEILLPVGFLLQQQEDPILLVNVKKPAPVSGHTLIGFYL